MVALKEEAEDSQLRSIPSYYEEKKKGRELAEIKQEEELKNLFENVLKFYNENYPKSTKKIPIKWYDPKKKLSLSGKKGFFEELKDLSLEEKYIAREIIFYSIEEHNYTTVDNYWELNGLRGRIKNLIPGGNILEKIEKIKGDKRKQEEELSELERQYQEALLKDERERIESKSTKIVCKVAGCGKVCSSPAGLASHVRSVHKPKPRFPIPSVPKPDLPKPKETLTIE